MANPVQPSSRAIAVLTRGYVERAKYDELINRNRKISLILQNREIPLVYGQFEADEAFVTRGLNEFTLQFLKEETGHLHNLQPVGGPYSNVMALNIDFLKGNGLQTGSIYEYRWGDLPLWGEVLKYILKPENHRLLDSIRCYHGSHSMLVNGPDKKSVLNFNSG